MLVYLYSIGFQNTKVREGYGFVDTCVDRGFKRPISFRERGGSPKVEWDSGLRRFLNGCRWCHTAVFVAWNQVVKEFGLRCAKATLGSRTTPRRSSDPVEEDQPSGWLLLAAEAVKNRCDEAGLLDDKTHEPPRDARAAPAR